MELVKQIQFVVAQLRSELQDQIKTILIIG